MGRDGESSSRKRKHRDASSSSDDDRRGGGDRKDTGVTRDRDRDRDRGHDRARESDRGVGRDRERGGRDRDEGGDRERDRDRDGGDRERDRGGKESGGSGSRSSRREEKERKREERAKKKVLQKLLESTDEKRERRLRKKAQKEAKRSQREEDSLGGYTNNINPFGDSNLNEQFVWKLKREKELESGARNPDYYDARRVRMRREELRQELDKAKKRRVEREQEREAFEAERTRMAREREGQSYDDWEKQEDEFHLEQAKRRSQIRIAQGRPQPIDILYKNLNMDADYEIEMNEPYKLFSDLSLDELQALRKDIIVYLELDPTHIEFWEALAIVCDDEIAQAQIREGLDNRDHRNQALGVHQSVAEDINSVLRGKTHSQLSTMHEQVVMKLTNRNAVDSEYWESLMKRLIVHKAKAKLREIHASLLRRKLETLQTKQEELESMDFLHGKKKEAQTAEQIARTAALAAHNLPPSDVRKGKARAEDEEEQKAKAARAQKEEEDEEALAGSYSPMLLNTIEEDEEVLDPERDLEMLQEQRKMVLRREAQKMRERMAAVRESSGGGGGYGSSLAITIGGGPSALGLPTEQQMYQLEAERSMEENEESFNVEVEVDISALSASASKRVYAWQDKYRPRKPRYFNRVHTGYEWNKYNQSHYDHDNPPPKIVQGYKFNIFYPDLIDKSVPPRYFIEPCEQDDRHSNSALLGEDGEIEQTALIRFHAGPPYEDIAFKIVAREWEYSHKKGFKCVFERGILHLWFNFRRYRYRR